MPPQLTPSPTGGLEPGLADLVSSAMTEYHVPGLALGLVTPEGVVLRGFGVTSNENPLPVDAGTIFVAASITKTVVATAVMCLTDRGKVDLDFPVRTYLPDLHLADEKVAEAVTMRHLLTHTGGWIGDEFEERDFGMGDDALARAIADLERRPQISPLGSIWSYNNTGFWLAGRVIEVVTGECLEAAITRMVFQPLEMSSSFFFEADAITRRCAVGHSVTENGQLVVVRPWSTPRASHAAGGMLTTITDLMTYAQFHLGDGLAAGGVRVLERETLMSMQQPLVQAVSPEHAGIGWAVRDVAGKRVISHDGDWNGQQSSLLIAPGRGFAIASLANSGIARSANNAIAEWALSRYLGGADPEPLPVDREDDRLDALAGRYMLPGRKIEIIRRGMRLGVVYTPVAVPGVNNPALPEMPAALTKDGRIVPLAGPFKGVTGDFSIEPDGSAGWLRVGGRLYPREGHSLV